MSQIMIMNLKVLVLMLTLTPMMPLLYLLAHLMECPWLIPLAIVMTQHLMTHNTMIIINKRKE